MNEFQNFDTCFGRPKLLKKITQNIYDHSEDILYIFLLVIIVGELDSLHRYHEIYMALHDLRFHRDDQSGHRVYNTIQYG